MNFKSISNFFVSILICSIFFGCANDSSSSSTNAATTNTSGNSTSPEVITDFPSGTTVWEGNCMFLADDSDNWFSRPDGFINVSFSEVSEGDLILITHKENSMSNHKWAAFEFQGYNWKGGRFKNKGKGVNCKIETWPAEPEKDITERGVLKPYTPTQTTGIYLTTEDAAIINQTGGMVLYGCGYTVTKIVVVSKTLEINVQNVTFKTDFTVTSPAGDVKTDIGFRIESNKAYFLYWNNTVNQWNRVEVAEESVSAGSELPIFHMQADYTLNKKNQSGVMTIKSIYLSDSDLPADVFCKNNVFNFYYSADLSSITLVLSSDRTKSYTFAKDKKN